MYFFFANAIFRKKFMMHHKIRKPHPLKIRRYAARMTKRNKYLYFLLKFKQPNW